MIDAAIAELAPVVGTKTACEVLGESRARHYRRHRASPPREGPARVPKPQPRALSAAEREEVHAVLTDDDHVDESPWTIYAKLLDEGRYLCSVPTMYRILRSRGEVSERRRLASHPARVKPELVATKPNSVWSWDITKLKGPEKWSYFYLHVILDIFSRYVTGWMLARAENAALAKVLVSQAIARQGITRDELTLHSDRGSPMTAKPFAFLLADLGITKSYSRPTRPMTTPIPRASSTP